MGRRPKTDRVPRTRAGGTWTEAQFWGFLRSGLRQLSRRWPPRAEALKAARIPYVGDNKRRKWSSICAICKGEFKGTEVQADHIVPCGSLKSLDDLKGFVGRLTVEIEGFRVLCSECHRGVTKRS